MKFTAPLLAVLASCAGTVHAFDSAVVFNEIQYNAPVGQSEWIEIRNLNGVDVNLAGWTITGGIDYTFPATGTGSSIPGNGYLIIAANTTLVPDSIGPFAGQLDNGGETLRIRNLNGRIMDEVSYDDEGDWAIGADGSGATLARRDASAASGAAAWAASTQIGGTPGVQNFSPPGQTQRTLVNWGDTWKYRDADAAPPAAWNTSAYDDTAWSAGAAALGAQTATTSLTVTANLIERFRASDITGVANGAVVSTWTDTANGASYGDSVAQNAVGANSPTWQSSVVNGKAVVRFPAAGTAEMRTSLTPGITANSGWTIFMVAKASTTPTTGLVADGAGDYLLDRNIAVFSGNPLASLKAPGGKFGLQKRNDASAGIGGPVSTSNVSTSVFQIVTIRRNTALSRFEIWVNGVMEGTEIDDGSALTPSPFVIAHHATAGTTQGFKGDIAEVLIYKAPLSDLDFQRVGSYLENEYGLNTAFSSVNTTLSATAPTAYFRKSFNFPGDPANTLLRLDRNLADGAVFYLNGAELVRANMPAGSITHTTPASSIVTAPASTGLVSVPASALVSGNNVLAVSLHKGAGGTSSVFSSLLDSVEIVPPGGPLPTLRFSEIAGAADASFYIELENKSATPLNTSGWTINSSDGQSYPLPSQILASGALLSINAAALGWTPADGARLYLLGPGGTQLRDAREVTNRLRGLVNGERWGHPTTATPGTANVAAISTDIVINEIFYHAIADGPEQWIELYNKGAAPVDISGWKFSDGISFDFPATPAPTVIPAGGYLVVAWNPAAFAALHPGVTALGPWSGSLSGKGELVTLRDANDNIADQLSYADGGRWSQWADGGGSSLELKDPGADNSVAEAWDSSDTSLAVPWQTFTYTGTATNATTNANANYHEFVMGLLDDGEVLIDDISVKEVTVGNRELIQNGNFTSGTAANWRNIGTHKPSAVMDDPHTPGEKVLKVVAAGAAEHMNNHCETTLKSGATYVAIATANTYTISFRAKWLHGTNRLHTRLYFNRLAKQTLLNRPATGGTPGAANSRLIANAGPTFSGLNVSPVVPLIGQTATVSINAADNNGLASVELYTSVNGAGFIPAAMTLTNGVWSANILGQTSGTQVQFYVRAADSLGAISTFPADPAARAMIPWEDGRTQLVLPTGVRPHNIRIVMPAAEANDMYLAENVQSNFYRSCTVIVDDIRAYYLAGVRLKSSEHGRFQINRVGFNLKFGSDELFNGAHGTISVDRSGNKTTEGLDGTGVTSQREIIAKQVMNAAGGIYSQEDDLIRSIPPVGAGSPAALFNGAGALGEAILSKTRFDDEYLDAQWDNGGSGAMFKQEYIYPLTQTINVATRAVTAVAASGNLDATAEGMKVSQTSGSVGPAGISVVTYTPPPGTDAKENYRWHWLIKNAREADNYTGMIAALSAMSQSTAGAQPTAFTTQTQAALDVDAWLRAVVVPQLFGVTDNYLGNSGATHNFLLYFPPGQKGVAIPWDCDYLGQSSATGGFTGGGDLAKFIVNGANQRRYYCHVLDVINRSFNDAFLTRWAAHYSKFGVDDMTTSLPYLRTRSLYIKDLIMGTNASGSNPSLSRVIPFATFARTSVSPVSTASPFTTVTGNGWLDIDEIRLQGSTAPLAVTWTSNSVWSLQLPVNAGTNTYTLEALRKDGTVAGTTTVQVTGTGGIFPAGPGNLMVSEINYNPPGSSDATEFIELLNITGATLNLTGCHFDDNGQGIAFTFPAGYTIAPGARVLIVRDAAAFTAAYPGAGPVVGAFTGALDNGGEEIVLFAASGQEIFRFSYSDSIGSTDGGGNSLVRVIGGVPNPADYTWRASMAAGGNPGTSDALAFSGNALTDADNDGHSALIEYVFGTNDNVWNPATSFLVPGGLSGPLTAALVPNADYALVELQTSDDLSTWLAASGSPSRRYWRLKVTLR